MKKKKETKKSKKKQNRNNEMSSTSLGKNETYSFKQEKHLRLVKLLEITIF